MRSVLPVPWFPVFPVVQVFSLSHRGVFLPASTSAPAPPPRQDVKEIARTHVRVEISRRSRRSMSNSGA